MSDSGARTKAVTTVSAVRHLPGHAWRAIGTFINAGGHIKLDTFLQAANSPGAIVYRVAALLVVVITIALERTWYLRRALVAGNRVIAKLDPVDRVEQQQLRDIGEACGDLPQARVMAATLRHNLDHDFERLSDRIEEAILREAPRIDRYLWVLDTIVTLAPLLGLLGTIMGMFSTFHVLSSSAGPSPKVTGGVAEALLATASGLFVAIIGLVLFNALSNRVRVILHQLEILKVMIINRMYPHYRAPLQTNPHGRERLAGPRPLRAGEI